MCPAGISPYIMLLACGAIVLYTYGQHSKSRHNQYFQNIGVAVIGLILLYVFLGNCPVVALQLAIPLLIFALAAKLAFWAAYRWLIK